MLKKKLLLLFTKIGAPHCSSCGKKLVDYNKQYRYLGDKKDPLWKYHTPYGDGYVFLCTNPRCRNQGTPVVREHPWKQHPLYDVLDKWRQSRE